MEGGEDMAHLAEGATYVRRQESFGELGAFRELYEVWHSEVQCAYWNDCSGS